MQTVDKAFELLGFFSERQAEIGLSELARMSGFDKATARRLLLALSKHGLVEQNPADKRYRLGPGVLRLARIREATAPLATIAEPLLRALADSTGETAHITVLSGKRLSTIAVEESHRSNRVTMDVGETLPLHATASGLIVLAYADNTLFESIKGAHREAFTDKTHTDVAELEKLVRSARKSGYIVNKGWFEPDACSVAAPWFDQYGQVRGTIAVAAPSTRFSADDQMSIRDQVQKISAEMTTRMGGTAPTGKAA